MTGLELDEPYTLFFDSVPCPGWMVDVATLRVTAVNRAAIDVYGFSREEWVGTTLDRLVPEPARVAFARQLRRADVHAASGLQRHVTKRGDVLDVTFRWARPASRKGIGLAWAERTEDSAWEERSRVFARAPVALLCVDPVGRIVDANEMAAALVGRPRDALVGQSWLPLVADQDATVLRQALTSGSAWSGLLRLRRPDDTMIEAEGRTSGGAASGVHCLALQDVSERLRAEGELRRSSDRYRRLSDRSRHVREEERARLSRDLHDRLGQSLTGLKMDLAWLMALCDRFEPTTARSAITVMMDRIDTTIGIVRRIAADLRPGVLDRLGLQAAIEWRATEFERRGAVRCRVVTVGQPPTLDRLQSTELFRIFEEILTNVSRHSNATLVRITMKGERGRFVLHVYDNGRGIPLEAVDSEHSLGLIGMRERATLLGGTLTVSRGRRRGTLAVVRIPVRPRMAVRTQDNDGHGNAFSTPD